MLYELKKQDNKPVVFQDGVELGGTNIHSVAGAKDWFSMLMQGEQLDAFITDYETLGYAWFESKPVVDAKLRTEFDSPEQKARYTEAVTAVLAALRAGRK